MRTRNEADLIQSDARDDPLLPRVDLVERSRLKKFWGGGELSTKPGLNRYALSFD
jgi:hypothetical protein